MRIDATFTGMLGDARISRVARSVNKLGGRKITVPLTKYEQNREVYCLSTYDLSVNYLAGIAQQAVKLGKIRGRANRNFAFALPTG